MKMFTRKEFDEHCDFYLRYLKHVWYRDNNENENSTSFINITGGSFNKEHDTFTPKCTIITVKTNGKIFEGIDIERNVDISAAAAVNVEVEEQRFGTIQEFSKMLANEWYRDIYDPMSEKDVRDFIKETIRTHNF